MPSSKANVKLFLFFLFLFIMACGFSSATPEPTAIPANTEIPLPTATPIPSSLTVCLGQEPNTLYPYGGPNTAARSVLAAVYDGPIDMVGYEYQPVILSQLPSIENGDAQIVPTTVQPGGQAVDAEGNLVLLERGKKFRPAGCRGDDCIITYDGSTPLEMDQMVVTFRLREGLTWADGTPMVSDDSVYAYDISRDSNAVANTYLIDRTYTYEATDPLTVQWWGMPGFIDPTYFTNFWTPAPRHLWSQFPADQLPEIDIASRTPVGWGPYVIQEWIAGDHITLTKNPYYSAAADGFPKFDTLSFRFIADPDTALSEMVAGRCDILDPSIRLDNHASLLLEMEKGEQAQVFFTPGMTIEWLGIGTTPSTYDDGYDTTYQNDRPDFFSDPHTRQGIAYCLDRQSVVNNVLFGLTTIPATYLPVGHPLYDNNLQPLPFDVATGVSLLEQAGWKDTDGDPTTPRQAVNVKNVKAGTPLQLNYYTTTATQRRQVVEILQNSLAQCGIGLNVQYFSQNDLYASGPDGALFGRRFDLIEYAMGVGSIEPPCDWFTSEEIPTSENSWVGTNVTGYRNEAYDTACRAAQLSLPDEQIYVDSYRQTQVLFSSELPAIPLYYRLRVAAARPGLCHFELDPTANPLWNIEAIATGEACQN
ncbi:MAG TPA: ABC transporter substrate-binding protein [Anaerolineales bacterium]|nr:ABC transporter substrate-binding protein [Anaerolineales bacterium]HMX19187.1 ABC transporter substrate-binding protein [Anaerolineales bacterium]HMX74812.1 ABC transporter substrate-binding protein [Anaerolineales bacterium]HMZ42977.1 ABC transporter substrate-binding protein [Anaerolineales bacterium]HNA54396.1 ABC transporter substrate-binding protein [Anaerolineales bacterium]